MTKRTAKKEKTKRGSSSKGTIRDLKDLEKEELSGSGHRTFSTAVSSTDEDENEGLGDGNIGRSRDDLFNK